MMRRSLLSMAIAAVVAACGGGGADGKPRTMALYGDSIPHGDYEMPNGAVVQLDHPPAERLAMWLPGWKVIDNSYGGMTPREALGHGTLWSTPANRKLPFGPFAKHILAAPEDLCVMHYGAMDAAETADPLFGAYLDEMVLLAQVARKDVLLVGMDGRPWAQWPRYSETIRSIATVRGVPFVDISSLPVTLIDGLHGDQATSDAWTRVIAQAVMSAA